MRNITHNAPYVASASVAARLAVWNMRLLTGSAVLILWAACILALQTAGPNARALFAGEGTQIILAD